MPAYLASWQEVLEKHFFSLHCERSKLLGDQPIFALEHGLTEHQVSDLSAHIRAHVAEAPPSDRHWLAWAVYATELGYHYAGDEYWQTFEEKTPGWALKGDRHWLRECFWRFYKTYGGARPSGPWARHFSIICWPITHAILPEDLQRQLAEILYQIRFLLRKELFDSPNLLGNEIAARSWMASPRFQMLTEEPLLLGQIAAALLIGEEDRAKSLIVPETLLRIAKNLDLERRSREWLKDARAAARAELSGVERATARPREDGHFSPRGELESLGIEPRIYLRPTPTSSWEVVLEIPDLAPLLSRFPAVHDALNGTCVVTGSSGRPLARGRLLNYGPQTVTIKRWPQPADKLLQFEKQAPQLENMLSAECMLRPGPRWLFKISADGMAREIRGQIIRPGSRYILLSIDEIAQYTDVHPAVVQCEGISAAYLTIPAILSQQGLEHFVDLGLSLAKQVDVRPAGLPPVSWDGEGHAEWLSTDYPCICVSSDHLIKAVTLNLESSVGGRLDFVPKEPGEKLFVEMPRFPPGHHTLHVLVHSSDDHILIGRLDLAIRDPRPWRKTLTEQNALFVITAPPNPSLEQVWEGTVAIQVQGPASRQGHCELSFSSDMPGNTLVHRKHLPSFQLPLAPDQWDSYFDANVRSDQAIQNVYDSVAYCELRFSAEDLGQFPLTCRREFSPLRWIVRWENHGYVVRLRDDTGDSGGVSIFRYEFDRPDIPIPIAGALRDQPLRVPEEGGLFSGQSTSFRRSVILPPLIVRSLSQLRIDPSLKERLRGIQSLCEILTLYDLWSEARTTGNPFSARRRDDVLATIMRAIVEFTCGSEWVSHEGAFVSNKDHLPALKSAISRKQARAGFGAALSLKRDELAKKSLGERVTVFSQLVTSYLELPGFSGFPPLSRDQYVWTAEFVLRLMTKPQTLSAWASDELRAGVEYVLKCPMLARGARFLGLAIAFQTESSRPHLINLPNWDWP